MDKKPQISVAPEPVPVPPPPPPLPLHITFNMSADQNPHITILPQVSYWDFESFKSSPVPNLNNNLNQDFIASTYYNTVPNSSQQICHTPPIVPKEAREDLEDICTLSKRICNFFGRCRRNDCYFIHELTEQRLAGSVIGQQTFWTQVKLRKPVNEILIMTIYEQFLPALVKTKNVELLMVMLNDALSFRRKDKFIEQCIDALQQIKVNDADALPRYPRYDEVLESVLDRNGCCKVEATAAMDMQNLALCDVLLNLTVNQDNFLQYWPVIEKMIGLLGKFNDYQISSDVVNKIMNACSSGDVSSSIAASVLLSKLVDKERLRNMDLSDLVLKLLKEQTCGFGSAALPAAEPKTDVSFPVPERLLPPPPPPLKACLAVDLWELLLNKRDSRMLSAFFKAHCKPEECKLIVVSIIDMLAAIDEATVVQAIVTLKHAVISCLSSKEVPNDLQLFVMTLVFHMVIFQRKYRIVSVEYWKICVVLIGICEDQLALFHKVPIYYDEFKNSQSWYIFAFLLHGKQFALAMKWVNTPDFCFPKPTDETYLRFCRLTKDLFRGLCASEDFNHCKNLVLRLTNSGFNIEALQRLGVNIFDYYNLFIRDSMRIWWKQGRDIVNDAHESIYQFHSRLSPIKKRNILILIYLRWERTDFSKIVEIVDTCKELKQAHQDEIFVNPHLSVVEIQLITHVFFYKMLMRNQPPPLLGVKVTCGELAHDQMTAAPFVSEHESWDAEIDITTRVNYALSKFSLRKISNFDGVINVIDVNIILEKIRRKLPKF